jgi:hypothetical protein
MEDPLFNQSVEIATHFMSKENSSEEIAFYILKTYKGLKLALQQIEDIDSIITFKSKIIAVENPAISSVGGGKLDLARIKAKANNSQGSKYGEQNLWIDFSNPRFAELLEEATKALEFGEEVIISKKVVTSKDGSNRSFFEGVKLPPVMNHPRSTSNHQEGPTLPAVSEPEHVKALKHRVDQLAPEVKAQVVIFIKKNGLKPSQDSKAINEEIDRLLEEKKSQSDYQEEILF